MNLSYLVEISIVFFLFCLLSLKMHVNECYHIYFKYFDTLTHYNTCHRLKSERVPLLPVDGSKAMLDKMQTVLTLITCHILIWVYAVCSGLSDLMLKVITEGFLAKECVQYWLTA